MAAAAAATSTPAVTFETFDEKWEEMVQTVQEGAVQEVAFGESVPIAKASIDDLTAAVQARIDEVGEGDACTKDNVDAARGFIELAAVLQTLFTKLQENKAFFDEHVQVLASQSDGESRAKVLADLGISSSDVSRVLSERDEKYAALVVKRDMLGSWTTELEGKLSALTEKVDALKAAIIPGEGGSDSSLFDLETDPAAFFKAKALLAPIMGGVVSKDSARAILEAGQALAEFAGQVDPQQTSYEFVAVGSDGSGASGD